MSVRARPISTRGTLCKNMHVCIMRSALVAVLTFRLGSGAQSSFQAGEPTATPSFYVNVSKVDTSVLGEPLSTEYARQGHSSSSEEVGARSGGTTPSSSVERADPTQRFLSGSSNGPPHWGGRSLLADLTSPAAGVNRALTEPGSGERLSVTSVRSESVPKTESFHVRRLTFCMTALMACALIALICHMQAAPFGPKGTGGRDNGTSTRVPPYWSPENVRTHPFAEWVQDLQLWLMSTPELQPFQQASMIILRLGGAAREMCRSLRHDELVRGGIIPGHGQVDPVTYLLHGLQLRFAQLGEESRLTAMTDFMAFRRQDREGIDTMLARFDTMRLRAANVGQYVMSTEGYSLMILRAIGVSDDQLVNLLQPFGGRLPANDRDFGNMKAALRRMGHILEHTPGNIAGAFRGGGSRSHLAAEATQAFLANDQQAQRINQSPGWYNPNQPEPNGDWWQQVNTAPAEQFQNTPTWPYPPPQTEARLGEGSGGGDQPLTFVARNSDPEGFDSGTDSDTMSDSGLEEIDMSDVGALNEDAAGELLYWQMHRAKTKWRRFTNKPVRKARRFARRHGGKGGHHSRRFLVADSVQAYLKGKGKGGRSHSSGKGFGRRKGNPRGRDGQPLKCHGCGSTEHLMRQCPNNRGGKGGGGPPSSGPPGSSFLANPQPVQAAPQDAATSPLGDLLAGLADAPAAPAGNTLFVGMAGVEPSSARLGESWTTEQPLPGTTPKRMARPGSAQSFNTTSSWSIPPSTLLEEAPVPEDPLYTGDPWQLPTSAALRRSSLLFAPPEVPVNTGGGASSGLNPFATAPTPVSFAPGPVPGGGSDFMAQAQRLGAPEPSPAAPTQGLLTDTTLQDIILGGQMRSQLPAPVRSDNSSGRPRRGASPETTLRRFETMGSVLELIPQTAQAEGRPYGLINDQLPSPFVTSPADHGYQPLAHELPFEEQRLTTEVDDPVSGIAELQRFTQQTRRHTQAVQPGLFGVAQASAVPPPVPAQDTSARMRSPSPGQQSSTSSGLTGSAAAPIVFDGDCRFCNICLSRFEAGERVIRVRCRHMFHAECWQDLCRNSEPRLNATNLIPDCPNCRGPGHVIASWWYISILDVTQPGQDNLLTREFPGADPRVFETEYLNVQTPRSVATESIGTPFQTPVRQTGGSPEFGSPQHGDQHFIVLPSTYVDASLWESSSGHAIGNSVSRVGDASEAALEESTRSGEKTFHADTRLDDGRPSLLVDPGSRGNLAGSQWMREAAKAGLKFGHVPTESKRPKPLNVMGVGNGSQACRYDVEMPVALTRADGTVASGTFTAPTVDDSGLPALLGLTSLRDARALLDMHTLKLHFCGPNGANIELSPGSQTFNLEVSPSGHLVVPCCEFQKQAKISETGGFTLQPQQQLTLTAQSAETRSGEVVSAASSSSQ